MSQSLPTERFPRLSVDLDALSQNYQTLAALAPRAQAAAVVKANAYGCGAEPCAQALWQAGCRVFFVALASEGAMLRQSLPEGAVLYVLGPQFPQDLHTLVEHQLIPCVYDQRSIDQWRAHSPHPAPIALHVETGINRLGMQEAEFHALLANTDALAQLDIRLLMSHLACADEPDSVHNQRALKRFHHYRAQLPAVPASLANSAGIFLGPEYHFDLVRPGIALYGVNPIANHPQALACVATLEIKLNQIKQLTPEQCIGYGATASAEGLRALGVLVGGYADGLFRALYRPGEPEHSHALWCDGHWLPLHGRVSMDLITVDASALDPAPDYIDYPVEVFGPHNPIAQAADKAGTIAYELLTAVDARVERYYRRR